METFTLAAIIILYLIFKILITVAAIIITNYFSFLTFSRLPPL